MNAPAPIAAVAPMLRMIPIEEIAPSRTHIQALRRKRFDKTALQELADSIKAVGLLQPVVVVGRDVADYELVAGERRFLAAQLAGLAEIPATVRDLTPEQVLEVQLIENLQREGLHELEEAEGYDELMKLKGINADAVAEMVGKSRAYVYTRTKLLALCAEAKAAFYAGTLDFSIALLIARVPHADTQREAMKELAIARDNGDVSNFRAAQHFMREHFMLQLSAAPFDIKDATLHAPAGACTACPKRSGAQPELFADVGKAEHCTDPKCFAVKRAAHVARVKKDAEAKGGTVITGKDAKKILPYNSSHIHEGSGYLALETDHLIDGHFKRLDKALGKNTPATILVEHPESGALVPVLKKADAAKALAAAGKSFGYGSASGRRSNGGASAAAAQKALLEKAQALRVFAATHQRLRDRALDEADARLVANLLFEMLGFDSQKRLVDARIAADGLPKPKGGHDYVHAFGDSIDKLPVADLGPLMIECAFVSDLGAYRGGSELETTAKRYGLDVAKIKGEVAAEFKAKGKKNGPARVSCRSQTH